MDHGDQRDTTSCGVITLNIIAADIFNEEIWEQEHAAGARANCFIRLAHSPAIRTQTTRVPSKPSVQKVHPNAPQEVHFAVALVDHNFPDLAEFVADVKIRDKGTSLSDLMNPAPAPEPSGAATGREQDSDMPDATLDETSEYGHTGDNGDVDEDEMEEDEDGMDIDEIEAVGDGMKEKLQPPSGDGDSIGSVSSRKTLAGFFGFKPKPRDETQTAKKEEKRAGGYRRRLGRGESKSAQASHKDLEAYKRGELIPQTADPAKLARWKKKLEADDPKVEYHPTDLLEANHSDCGEYVRMGLPYQAAKWNNHIDKTCLVLHAKERKDKGKGRQGLAGVGSLLSWAKSVNTTAAPRKRRVPSTEPCPGLTAADTPLFTWLPPAHRCSGGQCSALLGSKYFKQGLRRPACEDKSYIYVNDQYRNQLLGHLFAKSVGLKDIIETADTKNTPCIRFAQRTLQGKYTEFEAFTGLVEAMVMKTDKLERGVGMQNFKYPPAWDELCHIVKIHRPSAAKALCEHFPVRGDRNFRTKEAREPREPRFPMEIGYRPFQLVKEHLNALDYHGPVDLSCDETKLFPGLRMYPDGKDKVDYLVGAVEGPIRVADPDAMKAILEDANVKKATKVRVWCLSIPLPGITPLVVAAMPIPNDMTAEDLLIPLEKILYGLLNRKIRMVSYTSHGTEVERSVQQILLDKADRKITHTISNPIPGGKDFILSIGIFKHFPIVMLQHSKHALKTFRMAVIV
ncbi:hypothetical protein MVEN_00322200 [Mycena venus]|uniref:Uncharacterized protein n=1 Tax=Mycena venus TaxID=2733690 RepID=A0A8H6YSS9_9AGAR|nr:hypothetical protein MVEN_00322200 [Mycena venus]